MTSTWAIVLAVALAIGGGIVYLTRAGLPAAGQPPLVALSGRTPAALQAEFDGTSSSLRVVLLLSPT